MASSLSVDDLPPPPQAQGVLGVDDLPPPPGIYSNYVKPVLGLVGAAANKLDSYTGAPTRAAIGEEEANGLAGKPISAFMNQFGQDPSTAPTGKQLLSGAGVSIPESAIPPISPLLAGLNYAGYHPTYNDVAGAAVEAAANPLNLIPGAAEAKGAEEAAVGTGMGGGPSGPSKIGKIAGSTGETLTGIPKAIVQHYYDNTDKINDLINTYGQDTAQHAIDVRNNWNNIIQSEKAVQNNKISQALRTAPKDPTIDITPIIDKLQDMQSSLNPVRHSDAIAQIDDQINTIKQLAQKKVGSVSPPSPGGAAAGAADLADVKSSYGLSPDNPMSNISPNAANQLPSLPKTGQLSDVQQFAQDAGLPSQRRIPINNQSPWPASSQAPTSAFRETAGLPPQNPVSGPINPQSLSTDSNAITAANASKFDPFNYVSPETYYANESGLHEIVKDLQMRGQSAYQKAGTIFNSAPAAANASKNAGGLAREMLINEGSGIIPQANKQLAALHQIEDTMNPNLLKPEGPPNAIFKAASNPGGFEANSLKKLGQVTGHDFISDAKDFATAQSMANSPMLPVDVTGKSVARQNFGKAIGGAIGGGIGYMTGGYTGAAAGGYLGQKAGALASSPAAMKLGINALNAGAKMGGSVPPGLLNTAVPISQGLIQTRPAVNGLLNARKGN